LDYDLYKGLIALKNYPGDPEDMSLTFTLDQEEFGQTVSIDLKKNGSNIPVTRANRMECKHRNCGLC
jgi:ubiquitin-protein ligase E3 C